MSELREKRRLEIIQAALKIFSEHGFYKAKMEEIAKEAGMGKGTVYEYFHSKKDLFQQMIMHMFEAYIQGAHEAIAGRSTSKDRLTSFARYHGRAISKHMDMAENIMWQTEGLSREIRCWLLEMKSKIFQFIFSILEEGIESGEIRKDIDPHGATAAIIGTINQNYMYQIYVCKKAPEEIDSSTVVDLLLRGIARE